MSDEAGRLINQRKVAEAAAVLEALTHIEQAQAVSQMSREQWVTLARHLVDKAFECLPDHGPESDRMSELSLRLTDIGDLFDNVAAYMEGSWGSRAK